VTIVEEYNKKSLYLMFLKCHHHLNPVVEFENNFPNEKIDENCSLNTFEMIINTSELAMELVTKELLIFR